MEQALAPTQMAYDRIQQAGTRSPLKLPNGIVISYGLTHAGIVIRGICPGYKSDRIVAWTHLARSLSDPLKEAERVVIETLENKLAEDRHQRLEDVIAAVE